MKSYLVDDEVLVLNELLSIIFPTVKVVGGGSKVDFFNSELQGYPVTNLFISKKRDEALIEIAVSGFKEKELSIKIENDHIFIEGSRDYNQEEEDKWFPIGNTRLIQKNFKKKILLPEGADVDKITAQVNQGIMSINIPLKAKDQKVIQIVSK